MPQTDIVRKRALKIACEMFAKAGYCTHYPGYTCDKGFPAACPDCIYRWLMAHARKELKQK